METLSQIFSELFSRFKSFLNLDLQSFRKFSLEKMEISNIILLEVILPMNILNIPEYWKTPEKLEDSGKFEFWNLQNLVFRKYIFSSENIVFLFLFCQFFFFFSSHHFETEGEYMFGLGIWISLQLVAVIVLLTKIAFLLEEQRSRVFEDSCDCSKYDSSKDSTDDEI